MSETFTARHGLLTGKGITAMTVSTYRAPITVLCELSPATRDAMRERVNAARGARVDRSLKHKATTLVVVAAIRATRDAVQRADAEGYCAGDSATLSEYARDGAHHTFNGPKGPVACQQERNAPSRVHGPFGPVTPVTRPARGSASSASRLCGGELAGDTVPMVTERAEPFGLSGARSFRAPESNAALALRDAEKAEREALKLCRTRKGTGKAYRKSAETLRAEREALALRDAGIGPHALCPTRPRGE